MNDIFSKVDHYLSDLFGLEDEVLKKVREENVKQNLPDIAISPNQGQLLSLLAKMCQAKRILEIGTLGGYSTIWLARALGDGGTLVSLELEEAYAVVARENILKAQLSNKVTIKVGEALNSLAKLAKEERSFDLFFIDADKPNYVAYFGWALKMSRPGSIIIADNVVRDGKILDMDSQDEKVIGVRNYMEMLSNNEQVISTIMQTVGSKPHDGMAISLVK